MQTSQRFTQTVDATAVLGNLLTVADAIHAAGIHDPAELKPLADFAVAAELREAALAEYRKVKRAHEQFAAGHDYDDPAHEEHQRRITAAHNTLIASERMLATTLADWRRARGL